jgi:Outer membrane protein beta-barrel domain
MRTLSLAFGVLLFVTALPGRAQTAPAEPAEPPRFYVGLAAYHSNYQNLGSWRQSDTGFRVPMQLTAGYQLRPRLALELGVAYSGRTTTYAYDGYYYDYTTGTPTASYFQYSNTMTGRTTSVSALARYTFTRRATRRLQADILGGFTLVHRNFHSRGSERNDFSGSSQTVPFDYRGTTTDLLLTAGLGLRYRLSPRFGLNFDITTNRNLSRPDTYRGFTGSAALGLRYRFGK